MSSRRDGSYVRSQRLLDIAKQIAYKIHESTNKLCSYDELIIWVQMWMGLTDKKAAEYINLVLKAKGWILKDGFISYGDDGN